MKIIKESKIDFPIDQYDKYIKSLYQFQRINTVGNRNEYLKMFFKDSSNNDVYPMTNLII